MKDTMDEWDDFLEFTYSDSFDYLLKEYDKTHRPVPVGDFIADCERIIKQEKIMKILGRLHKVQSYNIWQHSVKIGPERFRKVKAMARKKDMLMSILTTLYHFTAFDYLDTFIPVKRDNVSFKSIRDYYRKYTGIESGPRVMDSYQRRMLKELDDSLGWQEALDIIEYYRKIGVKYNGTK